MKSAKKSFIQSAHFYFFILLVCQLNIRAQESESIVEVNHFCGDAIEREVVYIADPLPIFPGGNKELYRYLINNIQFPTLEQSCNFNVKIFVGFIIDELGAIQDVMVLKGFREEYDSVAVKAIENMPNWIPGKVNDKPVKTHFVLPIKVHFSPMEKKSNPEKEMPIPNLVTITKKEKPISENEINTKQKIEEPKVQTGVNSKVNLYPNPVQEELFYSVHHPKQNVSFQIIDTYGQKHKWGNLSTSGSVQVGELKPGLYIFQTIQNNQITSNVKWIKL